MSEIPSIWAILGAGVAAIMEEKGVDAGLSALKVIAENAEVVNIAQSSLDAQKPVEAEVEESQ